MTVWYLRSQKNVTLYIRNKLSEATVEIKQFGINTMNGDELDQFIERKKEAISN